jgi:2-polyprenyl-3-methyl-5-hydroxy-6-metoxy-1,4-benzoquinol methylase
MLALLNSLRRNRSEELMDQPDLPTDQHQHALHGLARLNRFTRIAKGMYRMIRARALRYPECTLRLLDIASGSGDLPIDWAKRADRDGLKLDIHTLDVSQVAVETQSRRAHEAGVQITPIQADCLGGPLPGQYDLITNSLFMHHLDPPDVIRLLETMNEAAVRDVLICDLERSRLNLAMAAIGAHAVTRSHVVHTDASLSVRGAYTIPEFRSLCEQAAITEAQVTRVIPCRFTASWSKSY